jgi:hypothetical protein
VNGRRGRRPLPSCNLPGTKSAGKTIEDQLRAYFLYGKNVKKRSRSTIALPSIKFFNWKPLKRDLATPSLVIPERESYPA